MTTAVRNGYSWSPVFQVSCIVTTTMYFKIYTKSDMANWEKISLN